MQALSSEHSALIVHSGRQLGGAPTCDVKQEQEGMPPLLRHWLFGPQGEGIQGSLSVIFRVGGATMTYTNYKCFFSNGTD